MLTVQGKEIEEMVGEEPRATRLEQVVPPEQVTEEVATVPSLAGTPLVVVQYARLLMASPDEVANWLVKVMEEPRATEPPPESPAPGLMVTEELESPPLSRVPDILGVNVRAPAVGTMFIP